MTGTPIFEDTHLRHFDQPVLYSGTVTGPWITTANQEGLEPSCEVMDPPRQLGCSKSRKLENLKNKNHKVNETKPEN